MDGDEKVSRMRRIFNFITRPFKGSDPKEVKAPALTKRVAYNEAEGDELLGVAPKPDARAIMRKKQLAEADAVAPKR